MLLLLASHLGWLYSMIACVGILLFAGTPDRWTCKCRCKCRLCQAESGCNFCQCICQCRLWTSNTLVSLLCSWSCWYWLARWLRCSLKSLCGSPFMNFLGLLSMSLGLEHWLCVIVIHLHFFYLAYMSSWIDNYAQVLLVLLVLCLQRFI